MRITLTKRFPSDQSFDHHLYFCPSCGSEFYGCTKVLEKKNGDYIMSDVVPLLDNCPVCGSQIPQSKEYYRRWRNFTLVIQKSVDDISAEMRELRDLHDASVIEDKLSQIELCSNSVSTSLIAAQSSQIKDNPEALKKYIAHLIMLESNIYSIKKRLSTLYAQQHQNACDIVRTRNLPLFSKEQELAKLRKQLEQCAAELEKLRTVVITDPDSVEYPEEPQKPELLKVGAFDFIVGNKKQNEYRMELFESITMENYRKKVAECDAEKARLQKIAEEHPLKVAETQHKLQEKQHEIKQIENEIDLIRSDSSSHALPALSIKALLENEIKQAESLLRKLLDTRNQLYGHEVVFGKYRNLVALSSFQEYLMSGRCTSLEGANGAYNLYESELRADLIIGKLSDILTSLEQIKETQYTIVSLLDSINRNMKQLNRTMDAVYNAVYDIRTDTKDVKQYVAHIAETSEVIAHNTAVTAYYSKINAELTGSLGFMMAYKL